MWVVKCEDEEVARQFYKEYEEENKHLRETIEAIAREDELEALEQKRLNKEYEKEHKDDEDYFRSDDSQDCFTDEEISTMLENVKSLDCIENEDTGFKC